MLHLFVIVNSVYSMWLQQVSMDVLHHDFHEDDAYSRDCTAFKVGWVDLYYTKLNGDFKGEINICSAFILHFHTQLCVILM